VLLSFLSQLPASRINSPSSSSGRPTAAPWDGIYNPRCAKPWPGGGGPRPARTTARFSRTSLMTISNTPDSLAGAANPHREVEFPRATRALVARAAQLAAGSFSAAHKKKVETKL